MTRSSVCWIVALALMVFATPEVVALDRSEAEAYLSSAEKSLKAGDYQTAKSMCDRALGVDKAMPQAHFTLGQVQEAMSQPKEAIRSYQAAADFAKKENNLQLANKALDAAKKLGPGLAELAQADAKLIDKMVALGDKALADEQYDTAKQAYTAALALSPGHDKARESLEKTEKAIEARGDPVRSRIAAAMMSEVFYFMVSNKDKARELARDAAKKYSDLPAGKDAQRLLEANFDLSKTLGEEIAAAKKELQEQNKKVSAKPATPVANTPATPAKIDTKPVRVDVDSTEKVAADEIKKLPKDKVPAAFTESYTKGKDFYAKATPGTEGNQKNLASALEQFIRCEAAYLRLEEDKALTPQIEEDFKQASMLRYACMKMTILQQ